MALMTALLTGLEGLNVHTRKLDVIGNNIANVNTTSFKASRMMFENALSQDITSGSEPNISTGGTSPIQIGLGVQISSIQRDFRTGSINATGDARDLAIDGEGFFIVQREGTSLYTRAGAFRQDHNDNLVTPTGEALMGYGIDSNYNIQEGSLVPINIPLGKDQIAEATTIATLAGNLNTDGDLPSTGGQTDLMATSEIGFVAMGSSIPQPSGDNRMELTTKLIQIQDPAVLDSESPLFEIGQTLQIDGAEKGQGVVPTRELAITGSTTTEDLMVFLGSALGIRQFQEANPDSNEPGVSLDEATGVISITGNTGTTNDISIEASDVRLLDADGNLVRLPIIPNKLSSADGESVRTTMIVYDSLGSPVSVDVSLVQSSKSDTGTVWRYYVDANDSSSPKLSVATGTLDFDSFGRLLSEDPVAVSLTRTGSGAVNPLEFDLAFTGDTGRTTALAGTPSQLLGVFRNGLPAGTLESFSIQ